MRWPRILSRKSTKEVSEDEEYEFPFTFIKGINLDSSRTVLEMESLVSMEDYLHKIGYAGDILVTESDEFVVLIAGFAVVYKGVDDGEKSYMFG